MQAPSTTRMPAKWKGIRWVLCHFGGQNRSVAWELSGVYVLSKKKNELMDVRKNKVSNNGWDALSS